MQTATPEILAHLSLAEFRTALGVIPVWSGAGALASRKPVVLSITGAFAPAGAMRKMQEVIGDAWDAFLMHLPGNHAPALSEATVESFARAADEMIGQAFGERPVLVVGTSIGALVALGLRAPQVAHVVAVEPPLDARKLWPMLAPLQQMLRERPEDKALHDFADGVFGVRPAGVVERRYLHLLEGLKVPVDVVLGDQPLNPVREVRRYPSFVDQPEREILAAHPGIRVHIAPAGHDVAFQAPFVLKAVVDGAARAVLGAALAPRLQALVRRAPLSARTVLYLGEAGTSFAAAFSARNPQASVALRPAPEGAFDLVVVEDLDAAECAQVGGRLRPGGHLVAWSREGRLADGSGLDLVRKHRLDDGREPFDDRLANFPGAAIMVARKPSADPAPPLMRIETTVFAPTLMDIRTRLPAQALRSDPELVVALHGTPLTLPDLPPDMPKVLILQRPALVDREEWRKATGSCIAKGWIVVLEYDDHPALVAEVKGRVADEAMWRRFGYVHGVQTSTRPLADAFGAYNPEVAIFPNAVFEMAPFPEERRPQRIFYGAVWRGDFAVDIARRLGPAAEQHPDAEFVVIGDRSVFDALPAARKRFHDYAPYEDYLALMASCTVSLSPIEGRRHQETKSDAKFLDASRAGVLTIASPTIYAATIDHGRNGLIARRPQDWAPLLGWVLADEPARLRMAREAWAYVRRERMFAGQAEVRKAWYRDLWDRREALNAAVLARLNAS